MAKRRQVQISCKTLGVLISGLEERGIPLERAFEGMPFTREFAMSPRSKIPWEQFTLFVKRCAELLGGPAGIAEGITQVHERPGNELMRDWARYFSDLPSVYWALSKWTRITFPCVRARYERLQDGRIRFTLRIDEDQEGCKEFFYFWHVGMRVTPKLFNLPDALVDADIGDHVVVFHITPPPSRSILSRTRAVLGSLLAARATIRELSRQNEEMERNFEQLLDVRQRLQERETQVRLSAQLASLSNLVALGELAASISHEVNNPLMILYLKAGLLRRRIATAGLPASVSEPLHAIAGEIEQAGGRIASITQGLLTFAGEIHRESRDSVATADLVSDALNLCGERLRNAGIRMETPAATALQASCSRAQIAHALLNLLNNSYDALQSQKNSARWIRIEKRKSENGDEIEIRVIDSGNGVAPKVREKIFEPFFTTKEVGKGTGLGLSIAKGLIEANGGRLALDADAANTSFVITLPAAMAEPGV